MYKWQQTSTQWGSNCAKWSAKLKIGGLGELVLCTPPNREIGFVSSFVFRFVPCVPCVRAGEAKLRGRR